MKYMVLLVAATLSASAARAADLLDLYLDALNSDSQFASAKASLEAGRENLPQGRAGLLPNMVAGGSTTYNHDDISLPSERNVNFNSNSYQVQLTQPLFRWQNWVVYKQDQLQVGIAEAQFSAAQVDLIQRVAQAYFDVLLAQDVLASVQSLKAAASEQLQLSKKSFEVGTVTITDVNDAQSKYDLANAQEIASQNDLDVKRQALSLLTGKEPQALATLRPGVQIMGPQPADMQQWVTSSLSDNASVQAQQLTLEVAQREIERQRAGHLPTLDLVAAYGHTHAANSTSSGSPSEVKSGTVGVQLSLPLYQGGSVQSKVRQTIALADKAKADLDTAKRNAAQLARQSYLGVTSGIAQVRGYEAALVSSQSAVDSNKLGYQVGVRINIDVLNAESQLADTQQKLAQARYNTLISQLKLKGAAGSLSVADVQQINSLLVH
ncbi:MAG TPA: TolC family outer membrane protein [Rhodocyclaceae bacterium]|nr:TolC family outer membrane protein [Rhodocyclaceae bacterium]